MTLEVAWPDVLIPRRPDLEIESFELADDTRSLRTDRGSAASWKPRITTLSSPTASNGLWILPKTRWGRSGAQM